MILYWAALIVLQLSLEAFAVVQEEDAAAEEDFWSSVYYTCFISLWQNRVYIYSVGGVCVGVWMLLRMILTKKKKEISKIGSAISSVSHVKENGHSLQKEQEIHVSGVKIFFGSQTGTAKGFANDLAKDVETLGLPAEVSDLKGYDPDDSLPDETTSRAVCVFILATYTDGQPTENAEWFCKWLQEASNDFRYGKSYLKGLRYAVFGLGNSVYIGHYNTVSKNVDKWLWMLSGSRIMTRGQGDCNVVKSKSGSVEGDFKAWKSTFLSRLQALVRGEKQACSGDCKKGKCKNKKHQHREENEQNAGTQEEHSSEEIFETSSEEDSSHEEEASRGSVIDVEDLGNVMNHMKKAKYLPLRIGVQIHKRTLTEREWLHI